MFALIGPLLSVFKGLFGKFLSKNVGMIIIVVGVSGAGIILWWTISSKNAKIATLEKNEVVLTDTVKNFKAANAQLAKANSDLQANQEFLNQQISSITASDQQQQQELQQQILSLTSQKYKMDLLIGRNSTTVAGQQKFLHTVDGNVNCILQQIAGIPTKC